MSFVKLALQLAFWYAMAFFVPKLLAPFVGIQTANYIYWGFIVVYIAGAYILGKIASKQGHRNTEILPVSDDMPARVREIHDELVTRGLTQIGVIEHKPLIILPGTIAYVYSNKGRNVFAYAYKKGDIKLTLSCSFPDGFDVSTDYPKGIPGATKKIVRRVVKSSVYTALDFHLHHVKQHIAEHGRPKQFTSLRELFDWEDRQELSVDNFSRASKQSGKIWLRVLLAMIIAPILGGLLLVPVVIYFLFQGYEDLPAFFNILVGIVSIGSIILGLLWAYRPLYKPETVEERKKKEFA